MIERAYSVAVSQFDDNTRESMYDLVIEHGNGTRAAVEVTADADGGSIALWRLLNDRSGRWIEPGIVGGWSVAFRPEARAKTIRAKLPTLIRTLEGSGIRRVECDEWDPDRGLQKKLHELGISSAHQYETDYPGSIYLTIDLPVERSSAAVGDNGDPTARWLGEFLRDPARADVLDKLQRSGLDERHVFVILAPFPSAPFGALYPLTGQDTELPSIPPALPAAVTHAWVMSSWASGVGFHWHPVRGWSAFDTRP